VTEQLAPISSLDWRGPDPGAVILRGAEVVCPRAGLRALHDLVIRDGEIAELAEPGSGDVEGAEVVDADGLLALPAFFDPHVHLRTPGGEYKEEIETGTRAAAAGGFCGVVAMANTDPVVDTASDVLALRERADGEATVPTGFVAAITRGLAGEELTDMAELAESGAVGFSDDGVPVTSAGVMRRALQYQRLAGRVLALHEEDPRLSGGGAMHEGAVSAALGLAGIPSISESTMIARDAAIAGYEGARVHFQHLSARESVEAVERAKAVGALVSAEVTPHHLVLTDEAVRGLDAHFKMNPPLRSEDDRQALIEGLRSGTIDCVATDHAPHAPDEKVVPFEQAEMGVTGLETAFSVLHTDLVLGGVLPLELLVERMTAGAEVFGLEPSRIEPGCEANVVLVDPEAEWEAGADGWESRSENSCFTGRTLRGRVLMTVVAGGVVYRQRSFAIGAAA
jgi:dihydroorotase